MRKLRAVVGISGVIGVWALAALCHIYNLRFEPAVTRDGQYAFEFLFTSPAGWCLGSLMGIIVAQANRWIKGKPPPELWGWVFGGCLVAGVLSPLLLLPIGWSLIPVDLLFRR